MQICRILFISGVASSFVFSSQDMLLEGVVVSASGISAKKTELSKSELKKGQIFSERDLVRNETGVTVTEGGRSGNNGYAIRGVDSDRVSLKIDGMEAVESFMPRSYNILGILNGNRNSTELENISSVEFVKGANSLNKGSGAIGGSVSMQTKNVDDFVRDGQNVGFYSKSAYASKNSEFRQVAGAGVKAGGIEALFQHTYKRGKQTKNFYSGKLNDVPFCGMGTSIEDSYLADKYPELCSFGRILPDDVRFRTHSNLMKFGYRFDSHFINTSYEDFRQNYFTEEKSNSTATLNRKQTRDSIPYKRYGIYYEFVPDHDALLSNLKVSFYKQRVQQRSNFTRYHANYPNDMQYNSSFDQKDSYEFFQDKKQFDISGMSGDINAGKFSHILSFGFGKHISTFKNKNLQLRQSFNTRWGGSGFIVDPANPFKPVKATDVTFAQPVKSTLEYVFLGDDMSLNEALSLNYGVRLDRYVYKPEQASVASGAGYKMVTTPELQKSKFKAVTYNVGAQYDINNNVSVGYAFSTGFRAPRVEEMYFDTPRDSTRYVRNLDIKPEKAFNHEVSLLSSGQSYALALSAFYSKYRDFIDSDYEVSIDEIEELDFATFDFVKKYSKKSLDFKHVNVGRATVKGLELNSRVNGDVLNLNENLYASLKATYARGKKNDGTSLMAIQPFTAVAGLGYSDNKFDLLLTSKFVAAKKAKDAVSKIPPNFSQITVDRDTGKVTGTTQPEAHKFLSKSYFVFDLTMGYKISKNFSINAGVFNIFNKEYSTWENLRQLRYNGNQSYVKFDGTGLERYTAPGRNFSVSFEIRY